MLGGRAEARSWLPTRLYFVETKLCPLPRSSGSLSLTGGPSPCPPWEPDMDTHLL